MKAQTVRFGEIEVTDDQLLTLPKGIYGFPHLQRFALIAHSKDSPLQWMQSLDDESIALVVCPGSVFKKYDLDEPGTKSLVILTIPAVATKLTANFKAPIVFDTNTRMGAQVILDNPNYTTRHYVYEELNGNA